jgi:serine/threonine protein kinase/WD40 repeat protein
VNTAAPEYRTTADLDPLAGLRVGVSEVAEIALGSVGGSQIGGGRHLAMLSADSLELDLSDPAQRQLGDYELLELIGEGGMGVVYRAHQHGLDRNVAVKLLAAGPWASKDFIERFRREAQNAARMQHPNIVTIYEVATVEDLHFFSMRLVQGGSLASLLRDQGELPPLRAAQLLRTIAEAVDYAHRLGVLHLDLKPANVLIDEIGNPHVADFGLARRLEQGLASVNNEISGTPSYMAPEQATAGSRNITPATDIWGLGAVLYELVTGRPPFLGNSPQGILKLVVEGKFTSAREHAPQVPRDLEAIIDKCMAYDTANRYATARELADDLGRFIEKRAVHARPLNRAQRVWRWAERQPYLAVLALLFTVSMLTGIIGVSSQWRRAESNANRAEANATTSNQRLWESRREAALRLQGDGKGFEALPQLIDNVAEQEHAGIIDPLSIERHEIGAILSQGVTLIDRMILPGERPLAAELSPDGSLLAIGLGDQTVRWFDTRTLTEQGRVDISDLPTSGDENNEIQLPRLLRFIDNRRLLVTLDWFEYTISPSNHDTYLIDLEHARAIEPPAQFADFSDATYSADGRYALLFDHRNGVQFWQVEPWRALSARVVDNQRGANSWLLGRGGKFAILTTGGHDLELYDPRNLSASRLIPAPGLESVTAWAENGDGSWLALGDSSGHVSLFDPRSGTLRPLSTPPGRDVRWLAFSEDAAWLAAVRRDGAAVAFDVASGDPLNAGLMQQDFDLLRHVAISHRERLLVTSGSGETALWRLPEPGTIATEATRLISRPTRAVRGLDYSVGASLQAGLLVSAGTDGEVRVWRLPHSPHWPVSRALARMSIAGNVYFDGEHLPDVAYNKVRVVSMHGAPTPWIELPQPLAYAELLNSSKTLLATSGPALYVFDPATMTLRYPAVPLAANPIRLAASADGAFAVLAFGSNDASGFEEELQTYDLITGQLRAGSAAVKGPLRQFELSPDGSRLLTTGPPRGATEVFDATTLKRVGSYLHNPERPVVWASFTPTSARLWLTARDLDDETTENADLMAWNPVINALSERRILQRIVPIEVTAATGRPILAAMGMGLFDPGAVGVRADAHLTGGEMSVSATSHDGHLIAQAYANEVQLYDAATLATVGPPLHTNVGGFVGAIQILAFSTDDRSLFASDSGDGSLRWTVAADSRPLAQIREDTALLSPASGDGDVLRMSSAEQRHYLRSHDAGPLPVDEPRPTPPVARLIEGVPLPARDPATSPLLLDLTGVYTGAPGAQRTASNSDMPLVAGLPWGVAHLDGVDYDVRGIVELRHQPGHGATSSANIQSRVTGIRAPPIPIAALHVLLMATQPIPVAEERNYAFVRLHYRDGSTVQLPIRTQREVPGDTENDKPVPVAFAWGEGSRLTGDLKQSLMCNPRLPNPHPERLIASLDLETSPDHWSQPLFVAITAEPVTAAGDSQSKLDDGGIR